MSFQVYIPSAGGRSIRPREFSINVTGLLTLHASDLSLAEIHREAVMLVDAATKRLAFHQRNAETEPTVRLRYNKGNTSASVNVRGAMKQLGMPEKHSQRGRIEVMEDEKLIVIQLATNTKK